MNTFYPKIGQFRNCIDYIKHKDIDNKLLSFTGTVKLHGTNVSIVFNKKNNELSFQSRNNILRLDADNYGFMNEFHDKPVINLFNNLLTEYPSYDTYVIFGEYCGNNIQKKVALEGLSRRFVIFDAFGINDDTSTVLSIRHIQEMPEINIYNIYFYKQFQITIDFNDPLSINNASVELDSLTKGVEELCPFSKHFGIDGIGEGIVWTCVTDGFLKFKTKGQLHSGKLIKSNYVPTEAGIFNLKSFISTFINRERLKQAYDNSGDDISQFVNWLFNDVLHEEKDIIEKNNIDTSLIKKTISKISLSYLKNKGYL
jgi:hypothetical protein